MSLIQVKERGEVLSLSFFELRNYHGNVALMAIAVGFRVVQAALAELYGEDAPERNDLSVFSGHAGPGFRDAFEYTLRVVTRGRYTVDVNHPVAQYDPFRAQSYAYVISDVRGASVEVTLKPDFLPPIFYEYMQRGRDGAMTAADHQAFDQLKADLCARALELPQDELLTVRRLS